MAASLIGGVLAFASTNIDDLFVLTLLFAGAACRRARWSIVLGQYAGIAVLTALSLLAAAGLSRLPEGLLGLLGFVPIGMGIRAAWQVQKAAPSPEGRPLTAMTPVAVMALTIANGADNLSIYIPLFTGMSLSALGLTGLIFALMTGLWCALAFRLCHLPLVEGTLARWAPRLVPVVFMVLGLSVLLHAVC